MDPFKRSMTGVVTAAILALGAPVAPSAADYPVTVKSCGKPITFHKAPERAVSIDKNISEIMFALKLQERMAGVSGITGWYTMTSEFKAAMGDVPELAPKYPTMETLLGADLDFLFAGWYYGLSPGGAVTPASLAEYDVPVYVLTESCVHVHGNRPEISMETMYVDVLNIGKIFGREGKARELVETYKARVARIMAATRDAPKTRVFLYDSGEDKPFTAGKFAMPTAIIGAAGGRNIMEDVETSWGRVGWEPVIDRDPEFIIIVGYQDGSWRDRWAFMKNNPALKDIDAVENDRYLVLGYTEITPGPNNIAAIEKLARALHPDRVK